MTFMLHIIKDLNNILGPDWLKFALNPATADQGQV
jgi:hypothetical protein